MAFAMMGLFLTASGSLAVAGTGLPARTAVLFAVASAVIHIGYELALLNSYRLGAFNQVYPINRQQAVARPRHPPPDESDGPGASAPGPPPLRLT